MILKCPGNMIAEITTGGNSPTTFYQHHRGNSHAVDLRIRVITKLPNSEQSYKGKVKTHNYINRQNQSTTGKL